MSRSRRRDHRSVIGVILRASGTGAKSGALCFTAHFAESSAGRISRRGDGFNLELRARGGPMIAVDDLMIPGGNEGVTLP